MPALSPTTTVFIDNLAVQVPDPFVEGHTLSAQEAAALSALALKRYTNRMLWWIRKNAGAEASAVWTCALIVASEAAAMDTTIADGDDPIREEALQLARDWITSELAKENLPPPPGLDEHAEALLEGRPELLDRARKRVELRREVANSALRTLELTP